MYQIVYEEIKIINTTKVYFYVIEISNLKEALTETYNILTKDSWINKLSDETLRECYRERMRITIDKLYKNFMIDNKLNESTGEYIVSISSKDLIVSQLNYIDIPLGEIIGKRSIGNGGFDYYSENEIENFIVFGEAKYKTNLSAYGIAFNQIIDFINKKKDIMDYQDIKTFIKTESGKNLLKGVKAYSAGFSFVGKGEEFLKKVVESEKYSDLLKYKELILIGVKINGK